MGYLIFNGSKLHYGDEQTLEDHLKMCDMFCATPDCYDIAETIREACLKCAEGDVIVNESTYEVVE